VLTPGGCSEGLSYKGKGFIQLTWKANYKAVEDVLKAKLPEETIDIVANPDRLLETKMGLLSAMGFWEWQKLNNKVAPNVVSTDNITKVVNLKTESYEERRTHFTEIYQVFSQ
jgi:predicted chitinase